MKRFVINKYVLTLISIHAGLFLYSQGVTNGAGYLVIPSGAYFYTSDYTAPSSSSTSVAGNMFVSGDWTNNSGSTLTFTGGTVTFNGSGTQNITGSDLTEFYSLTISSGSSTQVPAGKYLTVDGTLTMTGSLSLLSNASSPCASLLDAGSNSGTLTVQRHLAGGIRQHFVCSPVDNGAFSSIHDATNGDYNVYWYDETNSSSSGEDGWTRIMSGTLIDARGYTAIYDDWTTRTFQGSLNTGSDITINVTKTSSGNDDADGWNLVGNPYPSPIDADAFVGDNSIIYGSLYFFDSDTSGGTGYSTADFGVYNTLTTDTAASGGGTVEIPNGTISIGQAFFVKKLHLGTNSLTFKNTHRLHSTSTQFFVPDPLERQRLKLSITNEYGLRNVVTFGFVEDATNGVDRLYDAPKLKGNKNLSFYSKWDNNNWAVLGLPLITEEEVSIPLVIETGIETIHTIKFELVENIPSTAKIYLKDNVKNELLEVYQGLEYSFECKYGEVIDRFSILINPATNNLDESSKSEFEVFVIGSNIQFTNPNSETGNIIIRDILGKELYNNYINSSSGTIEIDLASAYYLVSFNNQTETITKKIYIQ